MCRTCSFHGDTLVVTKRGKVPIRDVRAGKDYVWAWDEKTTVSGWRPVTDKYANEYDEAVYIDVRTEDGATGTIISNRIHPFFVSMLLDEQAQTGEDQTRHLKEVSLKGGALGDWVRADRLQAGHRLVDYNGKAAYVLYTSVIESSFTAYNLTVGDFHTYYVGTNNENAAILVHNDCRSRPESRLTVTAFVGARSRSLLLIAFQGSNPENYPSITLDNAFSRSELGRAIAASRKPLVDTELEQPLNPTELQRSEARKLGVHLKYVESNGSPKYPNKDNSGYENGFLDDPVKMKLGVGQKFDRYGGKEDKDGFTDSGSFGAPVGTSLSARSLPPGYSSRPRAEYRIVRELVVLAGQAAPWFDQVGLGVQYLFEWPPELRMALQSSSDDESFYEAKEKCDVDDDYPGMDCLKAMGYIELVELNITK